MIINLGYASSARVSKQPLLAGGFSAPRLTEMLTGRHDAANDTALITRQLTWLLEQKAMLYRPLKFRQILQVDSSIPNWVELPVVHKVEGLAQMAPLQMKGAQLNSPDIQVSENKYRMVMFGCKYEVADIEIERAAKTGVDISAKRVEANNLAAETLLENIAANGAAPGNQNFTGILNNPDVSVVSQSGSAATWATGGFSQIIGDLNALVNAVAVNSKENFVADTVVLPLAQYQLALTARSSFDHTAYELFLQQNPYVKKVVVWDKLATANAGLTGPRAMALDSVTSNGPRMLISQELTEMPAIRTAMGTEVAQVLITGGVLLESATAVAYMDGIG